MADTKKSETRVILGKGQFPVRFSFLHAHVPQPKTDDNGNKVIDEDTGEVVKMYSTQVLIDKRDTEGKAACDAAIAAVIAEYFKGKKPANLKLPLRDGDEEWEEKGEAVKGHWFFNCSSRNKPNVVGTKKDELTGKLIPLGPDEIKSGDYGRITVNFYGFDVKNKGVAAGLGNIQKTKDGEALGSTRSADDDFGDISDGFED